MLAGVGTLVCLEEEAGVRQFEVDHNVSSFDQVFAVR